MIEIFVIVLLYDDFVTLDSTTSIMIFIIDNTMKMCCQPVISVKSTRANYH